MKELLIVATSALTPEQEAMEINSAHPRVEYVLLAERTGADFLNYSLYDRVPFGTILRRAETMARSDLTLALTALQKAARYRTVVAMSERVGIPLALCKRLGMLKSNLIFRFTAWSHRQERLFRNYDLLSYVDHFIVESLPLGKLLHTRFCVPQEKISFIPYAVDEQYFAPHHVTVSTHCRNPLLFSAGETRGRDYGTLIQAVSPLRNVDVEIAAFGTWFARERDIGLADATAPNINLADRKPRSAMRESYARAACVVVPLRDNVFSAGVTVTLEALAMGRPVIATQSAGLAGYLEDGETGLLVPPGNPDAMRAAISFVLDNPEQAERLSRNGRAAAETQFGLERHVAQFEAVIDAVTSL